MPGELLMDLEGLLAKYPKIPGFCYEYGTAGFRLDADLMKPVAFRVGLYMTSLLSKDPFVTLGVMITASHNPVQDNGIKLVAASGEMMEGVEEEITAVCNMSDEEVNEWAKSIKVGEKSGKLAIGMDTRPSGKDLLEAIKLAVGLFGVELIDCGLVTTPQLHHYVRSFNQIMSCTVSQAEGEYLNFLAASFADTFIGTSELVIDCANGVGALTMKQLIPLLPADLSISLVNTGSTGELNDKCGADYVKLNQCPPEGLQGRPGVHYASFDGDADRVVFYRFDEEGKFHLLDGDKIAVLIAETFQNLITDTNIRIGVVQTAYANGASMTHLRKMGLETAITCTGIKNLHHQAKKYDVGIYFEANGHGTVLFSPKFKHSVVHGSAVGRLASLVNECVGDAISDLLLVEAILSIRKLSLADWESAYAELPNVQIKLHVKDRSVIKTANADQSVLKPAGMQEEINKEIALYAKGRAFVRPSGTEDVVRVYVEAQTSDQMGQLAASITQIVQKYLS